MPYDGKLLSRARERLEEIKSDNENEHRRRVKEVYYRIPEIREIDSAMRAQMSQLVKIAISKAPDMQAQLDSLKEKNLDLQIRRGELLAEHGYGVEHLDEIYSCKKCQDTGVYNNGVCDCLKKLYNQELTKDLAVLLRSGNESFENFDLSLYPSVYDPQSGVVPREAMRSVYAFCRKYAESFPNVSVPNLLLHGGTGLGKTYLSACIARVVSEKGCSVCYDSAASAFEAFEKQKFSRDAAEADAAAAKVQRMLSCDLMILDDLGTEMITPISISALYTLINTRLVNRKPMIISTNFTPNDIAVRYSAQIASRIEGEFQELPFAGRDIRKIKKEQ